MNLFEALSGGFNPNTDTKEVKGLIVGCDQKNCTKFERCPLKETIMFPEECDVYATTPLPF